MTVLVVEDHPMFREGILTVLEGRPRFEVIAEAESREAAREAAARSQPDVAILDISLADGDGLELLSELAAVSPHTRCVVLSVNVSPETVSRAVDLGAAGFVSKGAPGDELVRALETAAGGGETYFDPGAREALEAGAPAVRPAAHDQERFERLTAREREVFSRLARGLGSKHIAYELGISRKTVDVHRAHLMRKLELTDSLDIVRMAARLGLIDLDDWSRTGGVTADDRG
jgi:two-component system uhpT operon response regulator UhpA